MRKKEGDYMLTVLLVCVAVIAVIMAVMYLIGYAIIFGFFLLLGAIGRWTSKL